VFQLLTVVDPIGEIKVPTFSFSVVVFKPVPICTT